MIISASRDICLFLLPVNSFYLVVICLRAYLEFCNGPNFKMTALFQFGKGNWLDEWQGFAEINIFIPDGSII